MPAQCDWRSSRNHLMTCATGLFHPDECEGPPGASQGHTTHVTCRSCNPPCYWGWVEGGKQGKGRGIQWSKAVRKKVRTFRNFFERFGGPNFRQLQCNIYLVRAAQKALMNVLKFVEQKKKTPCVAESQKSDPHKLQHDESIFCFVRANNKANIAWSCWDVCWCHYLNLLTELWWVFSSFHTNQIN